MGSKRLLKAALFPFGGIIVPQETALHSTTTFCLCFKAGVSVRVEPKPKHWIPCLEEDLSTSYEPHGVGRLPRGGVFNIGRTSSFQIVVWHIARREASFPVFWGNLPGAERIASTAEPDSLAQAALLNGMMQMLRKSTRNDPSSL